jgi:hypothetical protein
MQSDSSFCGWTRIPCNRRGAFAAIRRPRDSGGSGLFQYQTTRVMATGDAARVL